jgi:hypothetical protein
MRGRNHRILPGSEIVLSPSGCRGSGKAITSPRADWDCASEIAVMIPRELHPPRVDVRFTIVFRVNTSANQSTRFPSANRTALLDAYRRSGQQIAEVCPQSRVGIKSNRSEALASNKAFFTSDLNRGRNMNAGDRSHLKSFLLQSP